MIKHSEKSLPTFGKVFIDTVRTSVDGVIPCSFQSESCIVEDDHRNEVLSILVKLGSVLI